MWWAMLGNILGSAAGEAASRMDKEEAMRLIKSVSDEYGKINLPELKQLLLSKAPDTQLAGIKDDPRYRADQNAAGAQLDNVINSGGLTLADRAALNRIRAGSARQESAGRHAIEQSMAARGALDSGAQLAMQLQGNQQAANGMAEADANTAGMAQRRAFEAIRERGRNAGEGLDRDYRQQSDRARAQDAINQGNIAIANTAARYNASIPQQNFDNQMKKTAGAAGATYATAGAHAANAKDTKQTAQAIGNSAGMAAQSGYNEYKAGKTAPVGGGFSNEQGGQDWGSDPSALSSEPTRPQRQIIGYRNDGRPIYAEDLR